MAFSTVFKTAFLSDNDTMINLIKYSVTIALCFSLEGEMSPMTKEEMSAACLEFPDICSHLDHLPVST